MRNDLYIITTLSNMHVGSGDVNFDIIDNQIQRDPITTLPNINSSSLKGAFREASKDSQYTTYIFGPENDDNDSHQTGALHFFEASLLSRPVRSNKRAYFMATSKGVIKSFLDLIKNFDIDIEKDIKDSLETLLEIEVSEGKAKIFENIDGVILEDIKASYTKLDTSKLTPLLGENIALFSDEDFKKLEIPIVARNALENGISKNLWYEEIMPKMSRFYFTIAKPTNLDDTDREKLSKFEERFDNTTNIQIGAGKSIGYGYCQIKKVSK